MRDDFYTTGTYFLLVGDATWIRREPYVPLRDQYHASVILRLDPDDGTGYVIKNKWHVEEPRLSERWTQDEMMMIALKAENR